jgi:hypothetical protein
MSNFYEFWSENEKGMLSVNNYNFKHFLEQENFFKNKPNENSTFNIIKKDGIFLKIKDEWEIKDYVLDYILNNKLGQKVYNLMTGRASLFKRDYLSMIKTEKIEILRDKKDVSYLFYKNGVVEITKDKQILMPYKSYGLHIWEDQIIKRKYIEADHHESEYRKFIWLISGGFDLPENPNTNDLAKYQSAVERYNTFQTVIGYLLHSYNSGGDNKAIILNDEMISDEPNGRSGKGLFWNALKHLKKVHDLNGKHFDHTDKFKYSGVKTDTQILVYDDVKKNFLFENLFSEITEGISITYKGVDTIKLPINESPKILVTTNYTLKGSGGSHEARKFEVELSTFFNAKYTPIDYFGHKLFDDWDDEEWSRFDCYMIECLKKYLTSGLLPYKAISLPLKKLQVELTKELFDAIHVVPRNQWINYNQFYENYVSNCRRWTEKKKTFVTQAMKNKYCPFFNYEFDKTTQAGVEVFIIMERGSIVQPEDNMPF